MHEIRVSKAGRPRNDKAELRILEAALTTYGEAGWHGFNMTKIAAAAGVGKSSMYTRWPKREDLFLEAITRLIPTQIPSAGTPLELLTAEVKFRMGLYLGPWAQAVRRLFVEMSREDEPVIRQAFEHIYLTPLAAIRKQLWEFKKAGILSPETSVTRLLDAIEGSVLMRAFCLATVNIDCFLTELEEYSVNLVRDQLGKDDPRHGLRAVS